MYWMVNQLKERPVLGIFWLLNLLSLPTMAFFGRDLVEFLGPRIGDTGIEWMLGGSIALLLVLATCFFIRRKGWFGLLHLGWIMLIILPVMYHIGKSPERWLHIVLFGLLGFTSAWFFAVRTGAEIALAYSFGDEFLQSFLPERSGTFEDVAVNAICSAIGVAVFVILSDGDSATGSESTEI